MTYRRGIVREVDGATGRARVEFEDQDNASSWWLHVNAPMASGEGSRVFAMPEIGSQVNCLVDPRGEEGTILGAIYSDKDKPPITDPGHIHMNLGGGLTLDYDKSAGRMTLNVPAGTVLSCNGASFTINPDGVTLDGPKFTVNAPAVFTKGFTASGGDGATGVIDGTIKVTQNVDAGQKVSAGQEVSAPVLRGQLAG